MHDKPTFYMYRDKRSQAVYVTKILGRPTTYKCVNTVLPSECII